MWNDWLSSLNGPAGEGSLGHCEIPDPIETPRRFTNPAQIERLQSLQNQHQQLQVQQLHLLNNQFKIQREAGLNGDSTCEDSTSSGAVTPIGDVSSALADVIKAKGLSPLKPRLESEETTQMKSEDDDSIETSDAGAGEDNIHPEVWKQFHALQAQQWAQALNQARIAKRQTTSSSLSPSSLSGSLGNLLQSSANSVSGGKRCKAYAAPKGVWKNNGGYNATIYVHKRRIYGPIRRDLSDAIEDRKEMEDSLRELTSIHSSPEDAGILEVEMREVVAGLRNRATPNRDGLPSIVPSSLPTPSSSRLMNPVTPSMEAPTRKRLRLVGVQSASEPMESNLTDSPDVLGPFASPLQVKPELDDELNMSGAGMLYDHSDDDVPSAFHMRGFTPSVGPVYGSPGPMFGSAGAYLADDGVDMLPDSGLKSLWG